jgi:hypothetical protein
MKREFLYDFNFFVFEFQWRSLLSLFRIANICFIFKVEATLSLFHPQWVIADLDVEKISELIHKLFSGLWSE